jgi:hypothetical protein
MNPCIWLSALAIRFIKYVTLAMGLFTLAQSVWAACEAEIQTAVTSEENYRNDTSERPMGDCRSFRDWLLTCNPNAWTKISTDELRAVPDMLKSDLAKTYKNLSSNDKYFI